jgi:hypothetical protein
MLYIKFGAPKTLENTVVHPSADFNATYTQEWLSSDWGRRVIREIDSSEYISGEYIESPVFGGIPPSELSTGAKSLIYTKFEGFPVCAEYFGENCFPLFVELSQMQDVYMTVDHPMITPDNYSAVVLNDNSQITGHADFIRKFIRYESGELGIA